MRFTLAFLVIAVLVGFGCKNDDDVIAPNRERSYLHILSAMQTTAYDMHFSYYHAETKVISGFVYQRNWPISGYADLESAGIPDEYGNGKLYVSAQRKPFVNNPPQIIMDSVEVELIPNAYSTICLTEKDGNLTLVKFEDDLPDTDSGSTAVRFINLKSSLAIASIASTDGTIDISNVAFLDASGFIVIPSGSYTLEVRDDSGAIINTQLLNLDQDGGGYTLHISGNGNGNIAAFRH